MASPKSNILLIGSGGVGTMAAFNLEIGGEAQVTAVLRSNFQTVVDQGFRIKSCDHGEIRGWRPSKCRYSAGINHIPKIQANDQAYDYIICATKNIPDVPPSLSAQIAPAVTPGHTVIVLVQNGLNIERPFFEKFPSNIVVSGVSMISSHETSPGIIEHEFPDQLVVGAFRNPSLESTEEQAAAKHFVKIYSAGGKTTCTYDDNVGFARWRKLVYNACLNPICAITDLDTGRMRLAEGAVEALVRPAMKEIVAAAKAAGHDLPEDVIDFTINIDPPRLYFAPSMLVDVRKGNFIEYENLVGEPLREGTAQGVPMPTLQVLYGLCQAVQWRTKEAKGLAIVPPKKDAVSDI